MDAIDIRAHITPDPETPPSPAEKEPPPDIEPVPADPLVEEPVPKPPPMKA